MNLCRGTKHTVRHTASLGGKKPNSEAIFLSNFIPK